jgi:hypothetical protein
MELQSLINSYYMAQSFPDAVLGQQIKDYCLQQITAIIGATAPPPSGTSQTLESVVIGLHSKVDLDGSGDHEIMLAGVGELTGMWVALGLPRSEFNNIMGQYPNGADALPVIVNRMLQHISV